VSEFSGPVSHCSLLALTPSPQTTGVTGGGRVNGSSEHARMLTKRTPAYLMAARKRAPLWHPYALSGSRLMTM
jgi:PAB1-binding protein PBP1